MINIPMVGRLVSLALEEDLALGDITSRLTIPAKSRSTANVVAKEKLVVCGVDLPGLIFHQMGAGATVEPLVRDGEEVEAGQVMVKIEGKTRELLGAERTILNFLQRCCGVATHTRRFVAHAGQIVVLDTRKTMPGWRILDKYAVSIGGGRNHRLSLGDMIMVKNNHVDASVGDTASEKIKNCLKTVMQQKPFFMPVEVEIRNIEELDAALDFKPDVVMFDNMSHEDIQNGLRVVKAKHPGVRVEVSGNVNAETLGRLQGSGVHCVSVGALTTEAPNVDIAMRIKGTV